MSTTRTVRRGLERERSAERLRLREWAGCEAATVVRMSEAFWGRTGLAGSSGDEDGGVAVDDAAAAAAAARRAACLLRCGRSAFSAARADVGTEVEGKGEGEGVDGASDATGVGAEALVWGLEASNWSARVLELKYPALMMWDDEGAETVARGRDVLEKNRACDQG